MACEGSSGERRPPFDATGGSDGQEGQPARAGPILCPQARARHVTAGGVRLVGAQVQRSELVGPDLDELTGLPSLSYLVEQVQELQADARSRPGPRRSMLRDKVLVVVSLAGGADRHSALFLRARTASLLRAMFADDETIAQMRQGLFGVLADDRPDLPADCVFLGSMLEEFDVQARIWTERLPADGPGTASLLSTLLLGGEWVPG